LFKKQKELRNFSPERRLIRGKIYAGWLNLSRRLYGLAS